MSIRSEDCLGRQKAKAIYIVGGWDCLSFNGRLLLLCGLRSSSKLLLFSRPLTTGRSSFLSSVRPCLSSRLHFSPASPSPWPLSPSCLALGPPFQCSQQSAAPPA